MTCGERQQFIHAYIDGELDLATSLEIEQHMDSCNACFQAYTKARSLHTAIKQGSLNFKAPESLRRRVTASVKAVDHPGSFLQRVFESTPRWISLVASLAIVILLAWNLGRLARPSENVPISQQVLDSHIRSLLANHLTDVPSSDQHTVKPWFDGKTAFSPIVKDLSSNGFPLVGGRLDYINDQPVAALVFQRHKHIINLFTWPSQNETDRAQSNTTRNGYNLVSWTKGGMNYYAVSDVNTTELEEFAGLFQN